MPVSTEKKYPFKFLDSYNGADKDIFFGRDEEIKALYEMVFQHSMVLVYGASGTGKTSLIQCGLAGRFKSYDWLPLLVRRGSDINVSLQKSLEDAGGNSENFDNEIADADEKKLTGLAKLMKGVYLSNFKTIYLIFDQFEELFILGKEDEQTKFIAAIKELLTAGQPVKIIFSIREEYLGYLYEFERAVPQILRKKLRVEPMTIDKATDVLIGINNFKNSNVHIKEDELPVITEGIFSRLMGKKKSLTIQLPYLQVFLDKLYMEITKDETRKAEAFITNKTLEGIGDIGDVLRNFLEEQVKIISRKFSIANNNISTDTVWKILSPFSTLEGTKEPIQKKDLQGRLAGMDTKLINDSIEEFVTRRILNFSDSNSSYELVHDSLAKCIAEKRSDEDIALLEIRRLINSQVAIKADAREPFSEKQLNFIEPFLEKIKLSAEEEALIDQSRILVSKHKAEEQLQQEQENKRLLEKQRTQKRFIQMMVVALGLMIVLAGYSYKSYEKANRLSIIADSAAKTAQNAEIAAQQALDDNVRNQAIAEAKKKEVEGDSYNGIANKCESYNTALKLLEKYHDVPYYDSLLIKVKKSKCQ